ncbi:hypothetical protein V1514DRAFT_295665 [Lipomyces japonicus]|uniref:uncharacterized protein n=1 Tax=Lipomyces japonicus TaxID=56871 RepID=UPI0034CF21DD
MAKHVAVIGAGIAGARCAQVLSLNGMSVSVFEARNRLGGRVAESNKLGKPLDLGPNWLHGNTDANPISQFCKKIAKLHDVGDNGLIISPDGAPFSDDKVAKIEQYLWKYVELAIKHSKAHKDTIDPDLSFYQYVSGRVQIDYPRDKETQAHVLLAIEVFGFYTGTDIREQSVKFAMLEEPGEGENLFIASGCVQVFDHIAREALVNCNVYMNSIVKGITTACKSVYVELNSGERHEFDAVVCSIPLGCLKHNTIRFSPKLPTRARRAIGSLGYGTLEKAYLRFPVQFWDKDYMEFLGPEYASTEKWPMTAISIAHLPEPYAQNVLLFYLYGDMSIAFLNLRTDNEKINFFQPFYSRIPGFDKTNKLHSPNAVLSTSWSQDQFAGFGSYSNFQIGLTDGENDIDTLRAGFPEQRVWLAGEHCTTPSLLATIGGAYESGQHAAELVVGSLK